MSKHGVHYFAYGSNLSLRQMRRRCPGHLIVGRASLGGYRLAFPRPAADWAGGVAGVEPAETHRVEGAVYLLNERHIAALDRYEGIAEGAYTRAHVTVTLADGSDLQAMTYLAAPVEPGRHPPSPRYLRTLLEGARDHGLPRRWIDFLRSIPTAEPRRGRHARV